MGRVFDALIEIFSENLRTEVFGISYENRFAIFVFIFLISIIQSVIFMGFYEYLTKGVTLGKLITGTKAVNQDGTNITIGTAFLRSLCRIVPFEPFSALTTPCYPWHDKWTKTFVIDKAASRIDTY